MMNIRIQKKAFDINHRQTHRIKQITFFSEQGMEQQQEWIRLLTYSSKLQVEPLTSSLKEQGNAEQIIKQSADIESRNRRQISSCYSDNKMVLVRSNEKPLSSMTSHEDNRNELSRIKQIDQEDQRSQIQPFRYSCLVQDSTQTQNQDQRIIQRLKNTIRGLTDQVLAYRKNIVELTDHQNDSLQEEDAELDLQTSIYIKNGPIFQSRDLASHGIQIEALKRKLVRKNQEMQAIKKQNSMLIQLKQANQTELKELKIKMQDISAHSQEELSKLKQTIQQLKYKLKEQDIKYGYLQKKFGECISKYCPGKQCLTTSDQEPSFAQSSSKKTATFIYEMQDLKSMVDQLKKGLMVKDQSINYTQKMLIKAQTERMSAQIQRQLLQQELYMIQSRCNKEKVAQLQEELQIHLNKIEKLQWRILGLQQVLQEKKKQRKLVPEMMSQEETTSFLVKTLQKVKKSANLLKLLNNNSQFKCLLEDIYEKIEGK